MGLQLGGLVATAVGIGVMALLRGLVHDEPVYLAGVIPLLIGVALLLYAAGGLGAEAIVVVARSTSISSEPVGTLHTLTPAARAVWMSMVMSPT